MASTTSTCRATVTCGSGGRFAAQVEGRRPQRRPDRPKGVRAAGVRALLALTADPDLLQRTGREIARAAGTTHPTALDAVRRLEEVGAVATEGRERRWMPNGRRIALERWLDEYETVLRPAILVGRYRTPARTPTELDAQIAQGRDRGGRRATGRRGRRLPDRPPPPGGDDGRARGRGSGARPAPAARRPRRRRRFDRHGHAGARGRPGRHTRHGPPPPRVRRDAPCAGRSHPGGRGGVPEARAGAYA